MNKRIREATYTKEFDEYYQNLPQKVREKYDYVFEIMFTKYIVSTKFVKRLEKQNSMRCEYHWGITNIEQ